MVELVRELNTRFYSRAAASEAATAFAEFCSVEVIQRTPERLELRVVALLEDSGEARQVVLEFWNYVLDRSSQLKLGLG